MALVNDILHLKEELEEDNSEVYVLDLKEVVECLIKLLTTTKRWKHQLKPDDILKTLDY